MSNSTRAVVYLAFGEVFLAKALYSASTMRRHNPDTPIRLVTNIEFDPSRVCSYWNSRFDKVVFIDDVDQSNRRYKTNIVAHVDCDRGVYVDADTIFTGSIDLAWEFLEYFDICLRLQDGRQTHKQLSRIELLPGKASVADLPHWNGGVLMFRRSQRTEAFFSAWQRAFFEIGVPFDQPALAQSIFRTQVRVLSLDSRWNGGFKPLMTDRGGVPTIIHYHSMYDHVISRGLRHYFALVADQCDGVKPDGMDQHLRNRNRMRMRNEPIAFAGRRLYRYYWYRKYGHAGLSK